MYDELVDIIEDALSLPRHELIETVENSFFTYLRENNPDFYTFPRKKGLKYLFRLYDKHFFDGNIEKNFQVKLSFSGRLTSAAGNLRFSQSKELVEINFSIPRIFLVFLENLQDDFIPDGYVVNGILCKNPAEALLRVMEHEITHLVEYILYQRSSCKNPRFLQLSYQLFGHTENKHRLGIYLPQADQQVHFKKGNAVSFTYKGVAYEGVIDSVRKRATVMVNHPVRRKFYVPLAMLSLKK
jgi:hypothetical protein